MTALALALVALFGPAAASPETLVGALIAGVVGTVLLLLGQAVEHLLDSEPGDEHEGPLQKQKAERMIR